MKIGVQLFTVRKFAQKDLFSTLERLNTLGIRYVEAARISFNEESATQFIKAKEEFGTEVVSTQITFSELSNNFDTVVDFHKKVETDTAIISVLPTEYIIGKEQLLVEFAEKADKLAERYAEKGITLCYHHHDFEFVKSEVGTRYDIIVDNLKKTKLVLDTYWLTKSGISTTKLMKEHTGRIAGIHLRDFALERKFIARKARDYAVGEGVIDFSEIIEFAKSQGIAYGAIEQKTKTPFEELERSINNLKEMGYKDMF